MRFEDEIDFRALNHWLARCRPMPTRCKALPYRHAFTGTHVGALQRGMIPRDMDDKWFGVLREGAPDFYRSWTGFHFYRLYLRGEGRGLVVHKLIVNRGRSQYANTDDGHDREMVGFLIERMLGGQTG